MGEGQELWTGVSDRGRGQVLLTGTADVTAKNGNGAEKLVEAPTWRVSA